MEWVEDSSPPMALTAQIEQESDGRRIAEVPSQPGVMACGADPNEARLRVHEVFTTG